MKKTAKTFLTITLLVSLAGGTVFLPSAIPAGNTSSATVIQASATGNRNALARAKSYLAYTAFSKKGLKKQLIFEGYTKSEAAYGVKHCKANWKKQAVLKAKSYLSYSSFSKKGLYRQLIYEGFTKAEANYGVKIAYK